MMRLVEQSDQVLEPDILDDILALIRNTNPDRCAANLNRRTWKLIEELGEVAEAVLSVTSTPNRKGKSWDDVREEIADVLIVAADIAWTSFQDEGVGAVPLMSHHVRASGMGGETLAFKHIERHVSDAVKAAGSLLQALVDDRVMSAAQFAGDAVMAACDLATVAMPDQADADGGALRASLRTEVVRKLGKWLRARESRTDVIANVAPSP